MSWEDIPGWFSFAHAYDEIVEKAQDGETVVEIGVAFGKSLAYLARKVIDSGKDVRVIGVDPWQDETGKFGPDVVYPGWGWEHAAMVRELGGPYQAFRHMMGKHAPDEFAMVHVWQMTSVGASKAIKDCSPRAVFIDGHHEYEGVREDIDLWLPKIMKPGGIIAGHDYSEGQFPGVVKAVDETFGRGNVDARDATWLVRL